MEIQENFSLKQYNSFGVASQARYFVAAYSVETMLEAVEFARSKALPHLILGKGSNILFTKNFDGVVIHMAMNKGFVLNETASEVVFSVDAGAEWHKTVVHCVAKNWYGIENLSLIPGTVGAAPVQNIGAYGAELQDVVHSVIAFLPNDNCFETFYKSDCKFGYRDSIFKTDLKENCIITKVNLSLVKNGLVKVNYADLITYFNVHQIQNPTIAQVSEAVIKIRSSKLPNYRLLGNAGSFFKNPIVTAQVFNDLAHKHSDIKSYNAGEGLIKISAAWLIEKAGFKGKRSINVGTYANHALVVVNYGNATGAEIIDFAHEIQAAVYTQFGVDIVPEVNIL